MQPTLAQIRQRLAKHQPRLLADDPSASAASVALVLAGEPDLDLCMIRRAERRDDPWSGHLALPGGRADPADPHPRAVAERETREEVGLELDAAHLLGALSQVPVRLAAGRQMILSPFVYYLPPAAAGLLSPSAGLPGGSHDGGARAKAAPPPLRDPPAPRSSPSSLDPGRALPPLVPSDEVAEAFWLPLPHLWDPRNAGRVEWTRDGKRLVYPAILWQGHAIWGLTFRVLTLFSDVLDAPLPHLEDIPSAP